MNAPAVRTAVAHRYRCVAAGSPLCDRGDGKPNRTSCRHCLGQLVVDTGQWAAFEWVNHGRYEMQAAVRTFASRPLADDWAEARNLVVRFVPDLLQPPQRPKVTVLRGGAS